MTQLERLKQEVKALLNDINDLQRQKYLQEHDLNDTHFFMMLSLVLLVVSNTAWLLTFLGATK